MSIADTASATISVASVVYVYPGTRALDNVSFDIARGSVTALVGPNGAGKTTLLRCLAGLDRPVTGTIHVAGIDVLEEPRLAHASMGYLSDFFGLYDTLTIRQSLAYAASANGVADAVLDATVTQTAQRLDIADRLDQRCAALSRGLRQRVAIGQAIVHSPAVLLLDEPASGLDPEARHSLAALFTRLRDEGMTLMVSSHILAELDEYCTHMLVLRGGQVIEHRALGNYGNDGSAHTNECHVRVTLAAPHAGWREALAAISGARVIEVSDVDALLSIAGGAAEQARVLREIIHTGAAVASYAEETENLHQSYLRTVQPDARPT